jgi:hypothetical protein
MGGSAVFGQQSVTLHEVRFSEFITFYLSSIDIATGETDVDLFEYELAATSYPAEVRIDFQILINSLPLGLSYSQPFVHATTEWFTLKGPVRIRNTDLTLATQYLIYGSGGIVDPGTVVEFSVADFETILDDPVFDPDNLLSVVVQTGRLPDGTYRFQLQVDAREAEGGATGPWEGDQLDKTIVSSHPITLELISPGGPLEDTTNTAIVTTYPFFQWESDPCPICTYRIRVARFNPAEHSSAEDAIEDQTVWPLDQALGYAEVGNATSIPYPLSGAVDLEPGKVYAWQVQKVIPTTEGDETIESFIYAFKIQDVTGGSPTPEAGAVAQGPVMQFMQNVMGEEEFNRQIGSGGDLSGFTPNQVIILNGEAISLSSLNDINNALGQGTISVISVEVQ